MMRIGSLVRTVDGKIGVLLTFCSAREQWQIITMSDQLIWEEEKNMQAIGEMIK